MTYAVRDHTGNFHIDVVVRHREVMFFTVVAAAPAK